MVGTLDRYFEAVYLTDHFADQLAGLWLASLWDRAHYSVLWDAVFRPCLRVRQGRSPKDHPFSMRS
jgi:hypothetical protein